MIEGACLDQSFQCLAIQPLFFDLATEVEERLERLFASIENCFDGACTHMLDGSQPESDLLSFKWREFTVGFIDVRWQDLDSHFLAFIDIAGNFVQITIHAGKQAGHEVRWVIGLQIGRPIGNKRIRCRM